MSTSADFDEDASRRTKTAPYNSRHPVPTVQGYQQTQEKREAATERTLPEPQREERPPEDGKLHELLESAKSHLHLPNNRNPNHQQPYPSINRNVERPPSSDGDHRKEDGKDQGEGDHKTADGHKQDQNIMDELDPRKKRKNLKHLKRDHAPREVTDPVTHLPVMIHDSTNAELKSAPENVAHDGSSSGASSLHLERQTELEQAEHKGLEKLFPPPDFDAAREELSDVYERAITVGLGSVFAIFLSLLLVNHIVSVGLTFRTNGFSRSWLYIITSSFVLLIIGIIMGGGVIWGLRGWLRNKINGGWDDGVWGAAKKQQQESSDSPTPESTEWLNSILASIWPLINPDLFTSLADTLEDVMQASLPKMVRMISVEDLGQGSEAIRILGVRWLPTGAASKDVSVDGKIKNRDKKQETDRKVPGEGDVNDGDKSDKEDAKQSSGNDKEQEGDDENVAEGLEAEEGDFVNVEVAFAYRASSSGKRIKDKANNAHLFLAFYLPGKIRFRKLRNSRYFLCSHTEC